jgi:carbamoyltransferase
MDFAVPTKPDAREVLIGMAGARRHGCVAVWCDGVMRGACEVERVTRTRGEALPRATLPTMALAALETLPDDCRSLVISESEIKTPSGLAALRLDHHEAHAAMAYLTSPFERALVVVCDMRRPGVSVWLGEEAAVTHVDRAWVGPSFAQLYSASAEAIGLMGPGRERAMEALARGSPPLGLEQVARLWRFGGDRVFLRKDWRRCLAAWATSASGCRKRLAGLAAAVQQHLGSLLLELLADLRQSIDIGTVCLGGGLFHNTYVNTIVQQSGLFARTFVPVNPGNAGLAVGNALAAAANETSRRPAAPKTPFIGPGFSCEEIKAVLDNCKLTYQYMYEQQVI